MSAVNPAENPILTAIEHLKSFNRREAVKILNAELALDAQSSGERWRSIAQLAANIGELGISHQAVKRFAYTEPRLLERILIYCRELTRDGRDQEALAELEKLPENVREHSSVIHFRGTIASQLGHFKEAESFFRQALAQTPLAPQSWFTLSVIKKFAPNDPDIVRMEQLKPDMMAGPARFAAQFCYALGKAYDDAGDPGRAFAVYSEGADIMRREDPFSADSWQIFAHQIVRDYTRDKLDLLTRSGCNSERVIFVNGNPRSGTTLVEQILTSHSQVHDGAELNLLRAALIPAGDYSLLGALNYQIREKLLPDPWGELGRDYMQMINERFGPDGRIVDKTLNHSRMMGLLLHTLPKAHVIWLKRNPEDCALSCYRTFFTASMPWSWSMTDIAAYFRTEDMLREHWVKLYPDRILVVPYEELTADPQTWIRRILSHVDLPEEPQVFEPHKSERSVMTASVAQVRQPISTARIGAADAYKDFVAEFSKAYHSA